VSRVFRALRYRFRATFRQEWGSYLTLALLLGLIGGLAMGSLAAARRTQSSYSVLLERTNPSQIIVATAIANPALGNGQGYDPAIVREIAQIPHVTAVASAPGINVEPLGPNGAPIAVSQYSVQAGMGQGSVGGEYFRIDRLAIIAGRPADPARADEFVTSTTAATAFGFHVGEVVPMGFYTNRQTDLSGFGTATVKPYRRIDMRLVGIGLPVTGIVTDDVDAGGALGYFTPALTHELLSWGCVNYTETAIMVASSDQVAGVEDDITRGAPGGLPPGFEATAEDDEGKADRAIKPLSIALGVFGGIAALAALLIAVQVIGRQLRRRRRESEVLRALGAEPTTLAADVLIGVVGAIAVGSLLAVGIAVALSPLSPLGPIRPFYPAPGISFDWTVLGGGFGVIFVGLVLGAIGLAVRNSPERVARRQRFATQNSTLLHNDMLGLPAPAATGLRFALQSGSEINTVPMRSAIVGAALAAIVLIATVTFGASLDHLVSTPRLYGWNWSYALSGGDGGGGGDIPEQQAAKLLANDHYLSAYSGVYFVNLIVDGQDIPVISTSPGARIQPPLLHGHDLQKSDEIVVGSLTLASLHKRLGDTVTVRNGTVGSHVLRIVGVATMPAIGGSGVLHLEMGTGAVVSSSLIPALERNPFNDPETGPQAYLVDVRPGVNPVAARRSLEEMTAPLSNAYNFGVVVQSVLRPAEIVDYRSMGTTPAILGASLGAAALAALGLTLLASVRRRRRDLAVLKTLGFTRFQLSAIVAWQSNVAVAVGTVVGIPVGITLGRVLWDLFAQESNAVPSPAVPVVPIVLIALGALVLANVVAAIPGRIAARTPAALVLRSE
jgi:hypothetical protein